VHGRTGLRLYAPVVVRVQDAFGCSAGRWLDKVIYPEMRVANSSPVRRSVRLFPDTSLVDVLSWLPRMLDDLVVEPNWIAEHDPRVIVLAHGQQG